MTNLDSLLEQEKEKTRTLQMELLEVRQDLEAQLVQLDSRLKEEQAKAASLESQLVAEQSLKEEYNR